MDAVVAVNILHHFCKTEELYQQLINLLRRIQGDLMFFQAHRHDPPGQMADAFRNYSEDEFVQFVSNHTGLSGYQRLGVASDGRPLYKLWHA